MAERWARYQRHPSFVLGFHGTHQSVVAKILRGTSSDLAPSDNVHDWLGNGIYFWENDPQRAMEWAQKTFPGKRITKPATIGAVIDLGLCLDLTTRTGLEEVRAAYNDLSLTYKKAGTPLPQNRIGADKVLRELDCQVIKWIHWYRTERKQPPYDSVRAPFPEAEELYEGAGFRSRNHIQIALINPECVKGYFRPIE